MDLDDLVARLRSLQRFETRTLDGEPSLKMLGPEMELSACYNLMMEAAEALRLQEDELREAADSDRLLRRDLREVEARCETLEATVVARDTELASEAEKRREEWREAHVGERIREYRKRAWRMRDAYRYLVGTIDAVMAHPLEAETRRVLGDALKEATELRGDDSVG